MIWLLTFCLAVAMAFVGWGMGHYDAQQIETRTTTKSLNHASRLFFRVLIPSIGAAIICLFTGWRFFAPVAFMGALTLNMTFIPTLNEARGLKRWYVSPSNTTDRVMINLFGSYAGQVMYWIQVVACFGCALWIYGVK